MKFWIRFGIVSVLGQIFKVWETFVRIKGGDLGFLKLGKFFLNKLSIDRSGKMMAFVCIADEKVFMFG